MLAEDVSMQGADTQDASRSHAARVFADARRQQLELALAGRTEESAVFAQVAATARALLDELDAIAIEQSTDGDLIAMREASLRS